MFADYVYEMSNAEYTDKLLLIDVDHLAEKTRFTDEFKVRGFDVVMYSDDLSFRIENEEKIKSGKNRIVVVAKPEQYVPYDVRHRLTTYNVSLAELFPRLNTQVLRKISDESYDFVSSAYESSYDQYKSATETEHFIRTQVFSKENIKLNIERKYHQLLRISENCANYNRWFTIALEKARIDCITAEYGLEFDTTEINLRFRNYILNYYGKLSASMDRESPILVSKAMEFMRDNSKKFIIIVMDGMAEFDWRILSKSFSEIHYHQTAVFAMIPTVTSISRQCLLSGKYPRELVNPWNQSKEKQEFISCAKNMGFADNQISYQRGYEADFSSLIRCGAVIINEIDDLVHSQKQGRIGMFNDVSIMVKKKNLADMTLRFLSAGFDVFITADHGNTKRTGMGKLMTTGVETETKSRCMLVLKELAQSQNKTDFIPKLEV